MIHLHIDSIDLQANGVARHDGMVVFVRGALPGEDVTAQVVRIKPKFAVAQTISIERESSLRVRPRCPYFGVCGGCSMQHLSPSAQVAIKQRALEDQFIHLAGMRPEQILRPIAGPDWDYRYRGRLTVRDVIKKGKVLVGFHERGSRYVADMTSCEVLPDAVSDLLVPLRQLVESMDCRQRCPQIEVAVGAAEKRALRVALVFRMLDQVTAEDRERLADFADQTGCQVWLQPKGPETIEPLRDDDAQLSYRLEEFDLTMPFRPTDFTQVNHRINNALVGQAMRLLQPRPGEQIADLFCGLGNFSLPMARLGARVYGLEGSESLCRRAEQGARDNGLADQVQFEARNLFNVTPDDWAAMGPFDRLLIDPPREGAAAVAEAIRQTAHQPSRIVYVSCNPATLARDVATLGQAGYRLKAAGVINMFPHTSHVESIACLELSPGVNHEPGRDVSQGASPG